MDVKERKKIIIDETKRVFDKYKSEGLLSIYWYGSGFNDRDFNQDSDIDLIGIVNDDFEMKYENNMKSNLQEYKILDIRINIYYLSELNNGKIKGNIANFLPIKLWLINFDKYIHLHGKKYSETDFKMKKANYNEAIRIEYKMFRKSKKQFLIDNSLGMYFIKAALYYFYYVSCKKKEYFDFSYDKITENVIDEYQSIVRKLIEIKNDNYNAESIKKNILELDKLISK